METGLADQRYRYIIF